MLVVDLGQYAKWQGRSGEGGRELRGGGRERSCVDVDRGRRSGRNRRFRAIPIRGGKKAAPGLSYFKMLSSQ